MSRRNRQATPTRDDAGTTMVDVAVSMMLLSIFMAMFTTGVIQIHRSVASQESIDDAQSSINIAFQRLDRELRYASGITAPGQSPGGTPYVEYRTSPAGTPICTQLRMNLQTLETRSWNPATSSPDDGTWRPLLSSVTTAEQPALQPAPSTQAGPYTFWQADATRVHQRLRISLRTTAGKAGHRASRETAVSFTALNTSTDTDSVTVCPAPRPDP